MPINVTWTAPTTAKSAGGLDFATGDVIDEGVLDRLVSNIYHIGGTVGIGWVAFTPTLAQSASITITVNSARYAIIGKTAFMRLRITATSAGTATNVIVIGAIPAAIAPLTAVPTLIGTSFVFDASTGTIYAGLVQGPTASTMTMYVHNSTAALGSNPGLTIASGDIIDIAVAYELA